jgi:hypothetical protein
MDQSSFGVPSFVYSLNEKHSPKKNRTWNNSNNYFYLSKSNICNYFNKTSKFFYCLSYSKNIFFFGEMGCFGSTHRSSIYLPTLDLINNQFLYSSSIYAHLSDLLSVKHYLKLNQNCFSFQSKIYRLDRFQLPLNRWDKPYFIGSSFWANDSHYTIFLQKFFIYLKRRPILSFHIYFESFYDILIKQIVQLQSIEKSSIDFNINKVHLNNKKTTTINKKSNIILNCLPQINIQTIHQNEKLNIEGKKISSPSNYPTFVKNFSKVLLKKNQIQFFKTKKTKSFQSIAQNLLPPIFKNLLPAKLIDNHIELNGISRTGTKNDSQKKIFDISIQFINEPIDRESQKYRTKNKLHSNQKLPFNKYIYEKNEYLKLTNSVSLLNKPDVINFFDKKNYPNSKKDSLLKTNEQKLILQTEKSEAQGNQIKPIEYNLQNYFRSNQDTYLVHRPAVSEGDWVEEGDLLADSSASVGGELSIGQNILVAYMPWEGFNFEDAILISERLVFEDLYTSLHIEKYEIEVRETKFGMEQITNQIPEESKIFHLADNGIIKLGTWVKEGDILVGKVAPMNQKPLSPHEKLLYDVVGKTIPTTRDTSLRVPRGVEGKVIHIEIIENEKISSENGFEGPGRVQIYIAEKRKIHVGDKMAGRHGNKGIVSCILPIQDMPYLPDGTPIDMVLNPLGVPSRMNVGQIFECLLGLAGKYLGQNFRIRPFDEVYGPEASRSLVYSKLYETRLKTGLSWIFNPAFPGKAKIFDGRTGECFFQPVTIGQAYILKLIHLVDEKIHARSTGPYSLITQQPLRGRSKHGGQRLGEMEVWALEGFGAAFTLQELLTVKSDDMKGRHKVMNSILTTDKFSFGTPESFKVLIRELQALCLDIGIYFIDSAGKRKQIDFMKLP